MFHKIRCDQVKEGMYVQGFGGSWFSHPFWRAKFLLTSTEDVDRVRTSGVPYVVIDDERGLGLQGGSASQGQSGGLSLTSSSGPPSHDGPAGQARVMARPASAPRKPSPATKRGGRAAPAAEDRHSAERKAAALFNRSMKIARALFDGVRMGRTIEIEDALPVVDELTEAILQNRKTLLNVIRLKTKDQYTYFHSVAVCTLMLNMALHLGLDEDEARDFGLAGLLHDIGKMGVPEEILGKPGRLTDEEMAVMRTHPGLGYQLLSDVAEMPAVVLDAVYGHHEKIDGTGYPVGLKGAEITLAARLGAICDIYDALTSCRPYKKPYNPTDALAMMWSWQGHLDRKLLFSFMQSVGIFPTGVLVQLRTNRLGIVLQPKKRSVQSQVLAFYCTRQREFLEPEIVAVDDTLAADQVISIENPLHWAFENWTELSENLLKGVKGASSRGAEAGV